DELQEAICDYATKKETDEYSDDFESDEDGMLNEVTESNSFSRKSSTSTGKSVAGSPLLYDDASQKAVDLDNEAADDLDLSFHEKELLQIKVLEGGNIQNDGKDGEEGCLEGQNEDNDRKNNEGHLAVEEVLCDNNESDDLLISEPHKKRNEEENRPKPKPRMRKKGNASASASMNQEQKVPVCIFLSEDENQLFRSLKSRSPSVHVRGRLERTAKMPPQCVHGPESCIHTVSTVSIHLLMERSLNSFSMTSDLKLEDNGRKSPSVDSSDGMMKIAEGQVITDPMQQLSVNDQSEHGEAKNTSENMVKEHYSTPGTINGRVINVFLSWYFPRPTSSVHLKKKGKAAPSTSPVFSQYLGPVEMSEDKCMQKESPEFNKVDNLRAAVFQNWLENKKLLLLELKRTEKEKAEILRSNNEKKEALKREESMACFEAWKKKKAKEAKKLSEKKKLEELEEKKPAEQNKEKTEAAEAAFRKWNERKMEYLREQSRKEKQSERMKKKIEEDLVTEKKRVSVTAVEKWNEKKEEYIKKKKLEKFLEKRKREIQQAKKEEQSEKAIEEYERWL
ncbi:MAP9 protein, partial [Notiomystis cincta]|nr:MAP9 protein [Notiomystis cincta]